MRDPVLLAKQCATIDVLSEGRLLPAFGIGSPRGAGMGGAAPRHQDARPQDRRGAGDRAPAVARGRASDFRRRALSADGRDHLAASPCRPTCRCGSAARRTRRSGARRASAPAGRAGPRRRRRRGKVVAAIRAALPRPAAASTTTTTAPSFPFYFGRRRRPGRGARAWRPTPSAPAARPARYFAVGDADTIVERIAAVRRRRRLQVRPAPGCRGRRGDAGQTRRLIEEVLPLVAARWPKTGSTAVGR